ncbi:MAG: hypothetical protein WCO02_18690, partial [Bacteroidota bacterium]
MSIFKIKKHITILLLFILSSIHVYSQFGFVFRYITPDDEYPNDIIETGDGGFIISVSTGSFPLTYQALFIRLNKDGDTVCTKKINQNQGTCYINHLDKLDNGTFIGIGEKKTGNEAARLWLITITDSLKIIHDTTFLTGFKSLGNMVYSFIDHFHNLIVYGSAEPYAAPLGPYPYVYKISQTYDSLFFHFYTNQHGQYVFSMMEKPDYSGYYMSLWGQYLVQTYSQSQFLTLDYSFIIQHIDSIPGELDLYLNTKAFSNQDFLVTGKRSDYGTPRTDKIGLLRLDSSFNIKNEVFFGPEDTVTYPAYNTNLDFLNTQNIYLGGVANQNYSGIFSYDPSYILIGKFDSLFNLTWQKYFGGDMYYMVWSVIATTDGGCIIGASSNDYASQGEQRDIYILKVDSSGLITGINNLPPVRNQESSVYPNPGNNIIYVET